MSLELRVKPRTDIPRWQHPLVLVLSLAAGLVAVGLLFFFSGVNPFFAISYEVAGGSESIAADTGGFTVRNANSYNFV